MPGVDVCDGSLDPFEKMSFAFASLQDTSCPYI